MHEKVINKKTKCLLAALAKNNAIKNFYLAGGTALAMQYGHRKSIDLDWFNFKTFDTAKLKLSLSKIDKITIDSEDKNTLDIKLSNVKLSFLGYPYQLLFPLINWHGIKLADHRDIACMKLDAVSSRGSKKDFIDLYFILQNLNFQELFRLFNKKYKNINFNKLHILKSLVYFADADKEPMPIMLKSINWIKIKKYFQRLTKNQI